MSDVKLSLTVLYDQQFWIGIFELEEGSTLSVAKVTFVSQPRESDIMDLIGVHFYQLKFSSTIGYNGTRNLLNYKQMKRKVKKEVENNQVGTKSQQALKNQQIETKIKRKKQSKINKLEEQRKQFEFKQQKKREKHRGH